MQFMRLVFPAPLGPMTARISFSFTWKSTSTRTCRPPKWSSIRFASRTGTTAFVLLSLPGEFPFPWAASGRFDAGRGNVSIFILCWSLCQGLVHDFPAPPRLASRPFRAPGQTASEPIGCMWPTQPIEMMKSVQASRCPPVHCPPTQSRRGPAIFDEGSGGSQIQGVLRSGSANRRSSSNFCVPDPLLAWESSVAGLCSGRYEDLEPLWALYGKNKVKAAGRHQGHLDRILFAHFWGLLFLSSCCFNRLSFL